MRGTFTGAIARGIGFLAAEQLESGGFVETVWQGERLYRFQETVFSTALIADALAFVPQVAEAQAVRSRGLDFLSDQVGRFGVWKFPAAGDWCHPFFPPDADDTACASAALRAGGRTVPANEELLLANRDGRGLFYTWFTLRPRWSGTAHLRLVLPQLRYLHRLLPLFTRTCAAVDNVDAVVNANVLFYLGARSDTSAIAPWLVDILANDGESTCDRWYMNPFIIWYFFSRALAPHRPDAKPLIARKLAAAPPETPLEAALAICAASYWGIALEPLPASVLISSQRDDGGWPAERFYHGDDTWWGSDTLTTALAVQALACRQAAAHCG